MNLDQISQLAHLLGVGSVKAPNSHNWAHISCPLAPYKHTKGTDHSKGFGIVVNPDGESQMHCFTCGFNDGLSALVMELKFHKAELDYKALIELVTSELDGGGLPTLGDADTHSGALHAYPEDWLASFPPVFHSGEGLAYVKGRKGGPVPDEVLKAFDVRWDAMRRRVCFPIRDAQGVLYGLHGRAIDPHVELRYLAYTNPKTGATNPDVWFGEHLIDWNKPVVMPESIFDMARVYQTYRNVMTPYKTNFTDNMLSRIKPLFEIITLFDPDVAGEKAKSRIGAWAKYSSKAQRIIRHAPLPPGKDGSDLTVEEMAETLKWFIPLDPILGP